MNNKTILGLDLGTNSIGWALIQKEDNEGSIVGMGSRIIPMSQDVLGKFDNGVSISQTAERTGYRGIRRLRERQLLRRERLHRVLEILGFLPEHYASNIDFEHKLGQFISGNEPKLPYKFDSEANKAEFIFKKSFEDMLADFAKHQPNLVKDGKKIPYDWTIYYLRKKALTEKIEKEELAWLLLHFNQKRGYYQLRGEDEEENPNKKIEFYALKVLTVTDSGDKKSKDEVWYNVLLENGWIYRRTSKTPLEWTGKTKEFIVTTELNDDGTIKTDKDGKEKRSFRAPAENDWTLVKKKTEREIEESHKTTGAYIYDTLLEKPDQKIKGGLIRVVERKFYKEELERILDLQITYHTELRDKNLLLKCTENLYPYNEPHKDSIRPKGFKHLFLNDIIFYQRPLKSKKSLIANCKFEYRTFVKDGKVEKVPLKGIAKSHPLYQEFRLWQFIQNLKIFKRNVPEDIDVTDYYLGTENEKANLFEWLNDEAEINQKKLLKYFKKDTNSFRWNYVEDKVYPANETRGSILAKIKKVSPNFLNKENENALWHILYSVEDKGDIQKALKTFANKKNLDDEFIELFKKFPPYEKEYGAYSEKALKKMLPLMRLGKYWSEADIINNVSSYQKNIQQTIANIQAKEILLSEDDLSKGKSINIKFLKRLECFQDDICDYKDVEHFLASYLVYGRHSEESDILQWKTPKDIAHYLKEFKQHSLRNPIVEQVITETLRVVKDIWEYYGNGKENFFDEIHLELGREMKNPADKRREMTAQINNNENTNLRIKALLAELLHAGDVENVRPYSPSQQEILKIYEDGVLNAANDNIPDDIIKISKLGVPTQAELRRYKLWLQQGYRSPYTGKVIPLTRLFTRDYDIEHIIPQSRYFDDSLSNKVICETEINGDKGNRTAYEYMKSREGTIISLSHSKSIPLLKLTDYEELVKTSFGKNRSKMKKLLMEEIPEGFIERQLNDSRYISKVIKNLLSNIVRQENEQEAISKNLITVTGAITAQMKQDWGLEHIWNELITPRFQRLNELKQSKDFGDINPTTNKFLPQVPLDYQKGFNKKRIDHRHHALDALTIACITREHVNYLNSINSLRKNHSLVAKLRVVEEVEIKGEKRNVAKSFHKPWPHFTHDAKDVISKIIVSYKQNLRIINKTVNHYQHWEIGENNKPMKKLAKQVKGDNWAIRKPQHKDTISGLVTLKLKKNIILSEAIDNWQMITDKLLKRKVEELLGIDKNKKRTLNYFKENNFKWNNKNIAKVEVYYWDIDKNGIPNNAASRVKIDETFSSDTINSVTDDGIKQILLNHLKAYNEDNNGKIIEHPELAFSSDGMDKMNKNIAELNNGKLHKPIYKVRTYEPRGNKFNVGNTGNKKNKYAEAAKGTNLFFAIYKDEKGKRNFETIPLNIVIERQKQGLATVPELNEKGNSLVMQLSPNDLVYIPNSDEQENPHLISYDALTKEQVGRVYKMVSFSGNQCFFVRNDIATTIVNKFEFSPLNKMEKSIDGIMIKEHCIKLKVDRLGNIKPA